MSHLTEFFRTRRVLFLGFGVLLLALIAGAWSLFFSQHDPLLETPQLAVESLQANSLYFNGRARPWLLSKRPDLLTPDDRDANSDRSRQFMQAVQNPKLFRELDRQYRFDALLLTGDPSEYKPLLERLLDDKDWTLRYADHTSIIFRRDGGRIWELADLAPVRARFAKSRAGDQAVVLAQTAIRLLAARYEAAAKTLLDESVLLDPHEPQAANGLAMYYLGRGEWREAWAQVARALQEDHNFLPALATKTQLLYGMKHFSEAYDVSSDLITRVPDDPNILFYHAKIAHEAHAYKGEIAALEKLIAHADADGRSLGGYQLYLGQAYAAMGKAERAVDAFMLALDDPNLPDDQRDYARESIVRIKKRSGL